VLVVDGHALRAIDLLDLRYEIVLDRARAEHFEDLVGVH
jgi:hypothetical protein